LNQAADEKKFIILETNYKIYAYTGGSLSGRMWVCHVNVRAENELEIAILALFVDIRIRYKNLVVGKLDRANVKKAMEMGISAHQVCLARFVTSCKT
jgi:transcription initiation factor TFIIH subunit 4